MANNDIWQILDVDGILDGLDSPTSSDVYWATKGQGARYIAVAAARRALGAIPSAASAAPDGVLAQTFPRWAISSQGVGVDSGVLKLTAVMLEAGVTYSSMTFISGDTGATNPTHQLFGLYDDARNLVASTSDDTTTAWGSGTVKELNFTDPFDCDSSGLYYAAILVVADTPPTVGGALGYNAANALAPIFAGTSGSGLTALPDPCAALNAVNNTMYAHLS